jgi:hypothetical protein
MLLLQSEGTLNWWNFADYSVDELFPASSFDQSSHHCENRLSTEERAKFHQFNLIIYNHWLPLTIAGPSIRRKRHESVMKASWIVA